VVVVVAVVVVVVVAGGGVVVVEVAAAVVEGAGSVGKVVAISGGVEVSVASTGPHAANTSVSAASAIDSRTFRIHLNVVHQSRYEIKQWSGIG
jgi:hypothetical protein